MAERILTKNDSSSQAQHAKLASWPEWMKTESHNLDQLLIRLYFEFDNKKLDAKFNGCLLILLESNTISRDFLSKFTVNFDENGQLRNKSERLGDSLLDTHGRVISHRGHPLAGADSTDQIGPVCIETLGESMQFLGSWLNQFFCHNITTRIISGYAGKCEKLSRYKWNYKLEKQKFLAFSERLQSQKAKNERRIDRAKISELQAGNRIVESHETSTHTGSSQVNTDTADKDVRVRELETAVAHLQEQNAGLKASHREISTSSEQLEFEKRQLQERCEELVKKDQETTSLNANFQTKIVQLERALAEATLKARIVEADHNTAMTTIRLDYRAVKDEARQKARRLADTTRSLSKAQGEAALWKDQRETLHATLTEIHRLSNPTFTVASNHNANGSD